MGIEVAMYAMVAISAASAIRSSQQQSKAASAQKKSERARQRMADIQAARERASVIRQARVARGTALQRAQAMGAGDGSGILGGVGAAGTGLASQLGAQAATQQLAQSASIFNQQAATYQSAAATTQAWGQAIGGVTDSIFAAKGGWEQVAKNRGTGQV